LSAYLLDSHVFLWLSPEKPRLRAAVVDALATGDRLLLSVASVAELCIKASLGKLDIPLDLSKAMDVMGIQALPLSYDHAAALRTLPLHHRDPFDRLMIAQAMTDGLTLVTHDRAFARYDGLSVLWA
jgi:PIN domain nuclease of toxin-antitoxin system